MPRDVLALLKFAATHGFLTDALIGAIDSQQSRNDDADAILADYYTRAFGPAASQVAIKQLGTNGGGFFNANSAHPFENPNAVTNFVQIVLIFAMAFFPGMMFWSAGMYKDSAILLCIVVSIDNVISLPSTGCVTILSLFPARGTP